MQGESRGQRECVALAGCVCGDAMNYYNVLWDFISSIAIWFFALLGVLVFAIVVLILIAVWL